VDPACSLESRHEIGVAGDQSDGRTLARRGRFDDRRRDGDVGLLLFVPSQVHVARR
jgi:hypothetical protein